MDSHYTSLPPNIRRRNRAKQDRVVGNSQFYGNWLTDLDEAGSLSGTPPSHLSRDSGIYQTWSVGTVKNKNYRSSTRSIGNSLFYVDSDCDIAGNGESGDMNSSSSTLEGCRSVGSSFCSLDMYGGTYGRNRHYSSTDTLKPINTLSKHSPSDSENTAKDSVISTPSPGSAEIPTLSPKDETDFSTSDQDTELVKSSPQCSQSLAVRPASLPNLQSLIDGEVSIENNRDSGFGSPACVIGGNDVFFDTEPEKDEEKFRKPTMCTPDKVISMDSLTKPKSRKNTVSMGFLEEKNSSAKKSKFLFRKHSSPDLSQSMGNLSVPSSPADEEPKQTTSKSSTPVFKLPSFKFSRSRIRNSLSRLRNRSASYFVSSNDRKKSTDLPSPISPEGVCTSVMSLDDSSMSLMQVRDTRESTHDNTNNAYSGVEAYATLPKKRTPKLFASGKRNSWLNSDDMKEEIKRQELSKANSESDYLSLLHSGKMVNKEINEQEPSRSLSGYSKNEDQNVKLHGAINENISTTDDSLDIAKSKTGQETGNNQEKNIIAMSPEIKADLCDEQVIKGFFDEVMNAVNSSSNMASSEDASDPNEQSNDFISTIPPRAGLNVAGKPYNKEESISSLLNENHDVKCNISSNSLSGKHDDSNSNDISNNDIQGVGYDGSSDSNNVVYDNDKPMTHSLPEESPDPGDSFNTGTLPDEAFRKDINGNTATDSSSDKDTVVVDNVESGDGPSTSQFQCEEQIELQKDSNDNCTMKDDSEIVDQSFHNGDKCTSQTMCSNSAPEMTVSSEVKVNEDDLESSHLNNDENLQEGTSKNPKDTDLNNDTNIEEGMSKSSKDTEVKRSFKKIIHGKTVVHNYVNVDVSALRDKFKLTSNAVPYSSKRTEIHSKLQDVGDGKVLKSNIESSHNAANEHVKDKITTKKANIDGKNTSKYRQKLQEQSVKHGSPKTGQKNGLVKERSEKLTAKYSPEKRKNKPTATNNSTVASDSVRKLTNKSVRKLQSSVANSETSKSKTSDDCKERNPKHRKKNFLKFSAVDDGLSDESGVVKTGRPGWKSPLTQRNLRKELTVKKSDVDSDSNCDYDGVESGNGKRSVSDKVKFFSKNLGNSSADESEGGEQSDVSSSPCKKIPEEIRGAEKEKVKKKEFDAVIQVTSPKRFIVQLKKPIQFNSCVDEKLKKDADYGSPVHGSNSQAESNRIGYKKKFYTYEEVPPKKYELTVVNSQEDETWL